MRGHTLRPHGSRSAAAVVCREYLVSVVAHDAVAFAGDMFEPLAIDDLNLAAAVADEAAALQQPGRECHGSSAHAVFLYAFDLIELNGDNLRHDPLEGCKATLEIILAKSGPGNRSREATDQPEHMARRSEFPYLPLSASALGGARNAQFSPPGGVG